MDDKAPVQAVVLNVEMLLDVVRATAQEGLSYTQNDYDRERYQKLLDLACEKYASTIGLNAEAIRETFLKERGSITPKVGIDVVIPNRKGEILILQLPNGRWDSPGDGWTWANLPSTPHGAKPMRKRGFTSRPSAISGSASSRP